MAQTDASRLDNAARAGWLYYIVGQTQDKIVRIRALAAAADIWLTSVSHLAPDAPLIEDGFLSRDELFDVIRLGAVGEINGWAFDREGNILGTGPNLRVTSVPLRTGAELRRVCVASGRAKLAPLRAALAGGIVNGVVVDEEMARALLAP